MVDIIIVILVVILIAVAICKLFGSAAIMKEIRRFIKSDKLEKTVGGGIVDDTKKGFDDKDNIACNLISLPGVELSLAIQTYEKNVRDKNNEFVDYMDTTYANRWKDFSAEIMKATTGTSLISLKKKLDNLQDLSDTDTKYNPTKQQFCRMLQKHTEFLKEVIDIYSEYETKQTNKMQFKLKLSTKLKEYSDNILQNILKIQADIVQQSNINNLRFDSRDNNKKNVDDVITAATEYEKIYTQISKIDSALKSIIGQIDAIDPDVNSSVGELTKVKNDLVITGDSSGFQPSKVKADSAVAALTNIAPSLNNLLVDCNNLFVPQQPSQSPQKSSTSQSPSKSKNVLPSVVIPKSVLDDIQTTKDSVDAQVQRVQANVKQITDLEDVITAQIIKNVNAIQTTNTNRKNAMLAKYNNS